MNSTSSNILGENKTNTNTTSENINKNNINPPSTGTGINLMNKIKNYVTSGSTKIQEKVKEYVK